MTARDFPVQHSRDMDERVAFGGVRRLDAKKGSPAGTSSPLLDDRDDVVSLLRRINAARHPTSRLQVASLPSQDPAIQTEMLQEKKKEKFYKDFNKWLRNQESSK